MADEITKDGQRVIATWLSCQQREQRLRSELNRAECDTRNAEQEVAKWMLPTDAKPGEKICVWQHDSLFQVEVGNTAHPHDHKVTVRARGKHFSDLARAS